MPLPEQNVIVCHGDDEIAISLYIRSLEHEIGDDAMADANISHLDGKTCTENDLANQVMSSPFFTDKRLVVLTNPFAKMGREKKGETEEGEVQVKGEKTAGKISEIKKRFLDLLSNLPPTTTLVLVIEDARSWDSKAGGKNWEVLKASHFLVKWIDQQAGKVLVKPFSLPDPKDMPKWIQTEAAGKKCTFKPDAAAELAQYVGNDTRLAAMEIEKLALYVGGKRPVEVEDVMALSTSTSSATIWKLVDAIGKKDTRQALSLYHQLLETHDVNYEIYPMIVRQFRQLLMAREVLDERGNAQAIMRDLGVPQFVADNLGRQASNFTMPGLERIYFQLMGIEENSKNGQGELETAIDALIVTAAG